MGGILRDYSQPEWCEYPDALCGQWGCWSLVGDRIGKIDDCGECEYRKPTP